MGISREVFLAVAAIFSVILFFGIYYLMTGRKVFNKLITNQSVSQESKDFVSDKFTGILMTGVLPFIVFILAAGIPVSEIGMKTGNMNRFGYLFAGLIVITIGSAFFSSKSPNVQRSAPELRIKLWHTRHIILSSLTWLVYLFGYELFFRGILWFLCFNVFGFWWAVIINVALYSLVHVPKGKLVTYGAIPLGLLLCTLSYFTGSFLPAFLIHSAMAISTELFSVYHSPGFQYSKAIPAK